MENKKNYYNFKILIILFVSLLWIEWIFHVISFNIIFSFDMIRISLFSLVLCSFISFIIGYFSFKINKILIPTILFMFGLYGLLQLNFKDLLGNYMSFGATSEGGLDRVFNQLLYFIKNIKLSFLLLLIPFITITLLFIIKKDIIQKIKINYYNFFIPLLIIILLHISSIYSINLFQNNNQIKSNKELYYQNSFIDLSIKKFGISRFIFLDVKSLIFKNTNVILLPTIKEEEPPIVTDYQRYIDDTNWLNKMENENNDIIKRIDNFLINQKITSKNEMTGIFKDKNLILVMIEAFDRSAIHPTLTPTLYKLKNEGWYFDNYYAPKYSCTTGESEYIAETSVIPSINLCTPNAYKDNTYKTSIFNLFSNNGYYSSSYHNWKDQFYDRDILHTNMGSKIYYNYDTLDLKIREGWPSDEDLFRKSYQYYNIKDKFFSFVITSSTHFPYDIESDISRKYYNLVKDYNYPYKMKTYLTKAIDLDRGLEALINNLKNDNKLDDSVIVLFGDHHPLNMELSYLDDMSDIDRLEDFNIDRLPFIIYNSEMEGKAIDKTMSTFDILPTLANLFDLNYDPRYYVGKDVFSDDERIVIYPSGSWITDKVVYFSTSGKFKKLDDSIDDEYIKNINNKVNNYFTISDLILTNDYYKYR